MVSCIRAARHTAQSVRTAHKASGARRRRVAVFMAGLPGITNFVCQLVRSGQTITTGSGKSRLIDGLYGYEHPVTTVLDLDAEMRSHPRFNPAEPSKVYEEDGAYNWANAIIERKFQDAVRDHRVLHVVLDGTGTKVQRRLQRIAAAKEQGLTTILLYVRVTLETALRRNAKRQRVVPCCRLEEYQALIDDALLEESKHVDCFEIIDNDKEVPDRKQQIAEIRRLKPTLKPCVTEALPIVKFGG